MLRIFLHWILESKTWTWKANQGVYIVSFAIQSHESCKMLVIDRKFIAESAVVYVQKQCENDYHQVMHGS